MTEGIDNYILENFEGPLDLLWHLINRQEIDIYQVSVVDITRQFLSTQKEFFAGLDRGAEFISLAASLIWFKSKALLPKHEQQEEENQEEELDPRFDIIHHLLDYCRFKQSAKELSDREQQQCAFYPRGVESAEAKKNLGIAHLTLDDLAVLFREILAKTEQKKGIIQEEEWNVSDKITYLSQSLAKQKKIEFTAVFNTGMSKIELIVIFLALLEMMKSGIAKVISLLKEKTIFVVCAKEAEKRFDEIFK